jgi:hypothetical protein
MKIERKKWKKLREEHTRTFEKYGAENSSCKALNQVVPKLAGTMGVRTDWRLTKAASLLAAIFIWSSGVKPPLQKMKNQKSSLVRSLFSKAIFHKSERSSSYPETGAH